MIPSGGEECNPLGNFIERMNPKPQAVTKPDKKVPTEDVDLVWLKDVDHENNSYLSLVN